MIGPSIPFRSMCFVGEATSLTYYSHAGLDLAKGTTMVTSVYLDSTLPMSAHIVQLILQSLHHFFICPNFRAVLFLQPQYKPSVLRLWFLLYVVVNIQNLLHNLYMSRLHPLHIVDNL